MLTKVQTFYPEIYFVAPERLDPLFLLLLGKFCTQANYVLLQLICLGLGTVALTASFERSILRTSLVGITVALGTFFVVGGDPFFLKMHWFPMLVAALIALRRSPGLVSVIVVTAVGLLWTVTAGSVAFFGTALGGLFALLVVPKRVERGIRAQLFPFALSVLSVGAIVLLPTFPTDDYPPGARVAPISPLHTVPAPLLGPVMDPNPLHFGPLSAAVVVTATRLLCLALLCGTVSILGLGVRNLSVRFLWLISGLALVSGFLLLQTVTPKEVFAFAPFSMVKRLIPGIGLTELPWLVIPFSLVLIAPLLFRQTPINLLSVVPLSVIGLLNVDIEGRVFSESSSVVAHTLSSTVQHFGPEIPLSPDGSLTRSRSKYLVELFGDWIGTPGVAEERQLRNLVRLNPKVDYNGSAEASVNAGEAGKVLDRLNSSRWRTARPQQPGDWLLLRFDRPIPVVKAILVLSNGCEADFPRGMRVEVSQDGEVFHEELNIPEWHGPLQWSKKGYPYFGPQPLVELDFPEEKVVRAIRFIQTGRHELYDWSVAKVKLYRRR